ncbi:putative transposase-like protein [Frankliniella fusca]|uniref:Transposase-like protein n=1 Tax=Frankliniella fusca TaxID=407009 RepID=A0AAE1H5Z9_9NEOP|nr:putative transposase-like protein [Frankliniella fusca]
MWVLGVVPNDILPFPTQSENHHFGPCGGLTENDPQTSVFWQKLLYGMPNVLPGTTIYLDSSKAYATLGLHGFRHFQVNQSVTFKEGKVCINTIEGMWALVKYNRQKAMFDSYLAEFMIRRRWLGYGDQRVTFLEKIKEVYKLKCSDVVGSETKTAEAD